MHALRSILPEYVFLQYRKLDRADLENFLMKLFQVKIISGCFGAGSPKVQEVEISPVVFQIIGGCFHDILENIPGGFFILNTESLEKIGCLCFAPSSVMNSDIQERIDTEIDAAVQP